MAFDTQILENAGIQLIDGDRGQNYPKQEHFKNSGYCLFLSAKNVTSNGFEFEERSFIDKERDALLRAGKLQRGDIVLTTRGTIGNVVYYGDSIPFDCIRINSGMIIVRADDTVWNRRFLYFLFASSYMQDQIAALTTGSAVPQLPARDLKKFKLPIISRNTQDAFDKVVGDFTEKSQLNRRINQTLEAMAQAIFKSWFVDFDPVKAKIAAIEQGQDPLRAAMRAISGKTDAELDLVPREHHDQLAATAALFPDAMEESELWEIPKGWGIKSVSNIARFATGKIEVSSLTVENYISTENMLENRGGISHASSLPAVATVPTFESGNVLVSNIRPYFKKIWLARLDGGRSNDVLCFEAKEDGCQEFLYNLLYQDIFFEFMMRTSKGAKMPRGDKEAIAGWKFPCAPLELRKAFSKKVRTFYSYIQSINLESKQLSELRDTLLPKLLSGDLSVADSEMKRVGK